MVSSALVRSDSSGRPVKILLLVLGFLSGLMVPGYAAGERQNAEAVWQAVRSGQHVVLMRHALAPGTGDPANFVVNDCSTQRNLSDQGRAQAERIGARETLETLSSLQEITGDDRYRPTPWLRRRALLGLPMATPA